MRHLVLVGALLVSSSGLAQTANEPCVEVTRLLGLNAARRAAPAVMTEAQAALDHCRAVGSATDYLMARGYVELNGGDPRRALETWSHGLYLMGPQHPNRWSLQAVRALVLHQLNELADARAEAEAAAPFAPPAAKLYALLVAIANAQRDMPAAIDFTEKAASQERDPVAAVAFAARAAEARGDHAVAVSAWSEALAIRPDDPVLLGARAAAKLNMGDAAGAVADRLRQTERARDDAGAWLGLGLARAWTADWQGAILAYDRSIALAPSAAAFAARGRARLRAGDSAQGLADQDEAVRLSGNAAWALAQRGVERLGRGLAAEAIADLAAAIEAGDESNATLLATGLAHELAGERHAAAAAFERAATADPLAYAQEQARRAGRAPMIPAPVGTPARTARDNMAFAMQLQARCWLAIQAGIAAQALADCRRAVDLVTFEQLRTVPRWTLGVALAEAGEREAARAEFAQALRLGPNFAPAEAALRRLGDR